MAVPTCQNVEEAPTKWIEWQADSGHVILADGRRVEVRGGDEVLIANTGRWAVILDHRPATRH